LNESEDVEVKSTKLEELRLLIEKHEQQLEKLQQRIDSIAKTIEYAQINPRHSLMEKASLKLDQSVHRMAVLFILLLVISAVSSAFFSVRIGELLSLFSFTCIVIVVIFEDIYLFINRIKAHH